MINSLVHELKRSRSSIVTANVPPLMPQYSTRESDCMHDRNTRYVRMKSQFRRRARACELPKIRIKGHDGGGNRRIERTPNGTRSEFSIVLFISARVYLLSHVTIFESLKRFLSRRVQNCRFGILRRTSILVLIVNIRLKLNPKNVSLYKRNSLVFQNPCYASRSQ